jgi:hypothetical protein
MESRGDDKEDLTLYGCLEEGSKFICGFWFRCYEQRHVESKHCWNISCWEFFASSKTLSNDC